MKHRGDGHYSFKNSHGKYLACDGEHIAHTEMKDSEDTVFEIHFNDHDGYSRFTIRAANGLFLWSDGNEVGFRAEEPQEWEQWSYMPDMH